ncbi:MAG TPA: aminopeptidase P family N-terminal domain-containing protein, partial [Ktedonobacterales bacterium]|nr:aminopeptidase P family N-terminal domain-containing protein [Ktedonobacterales bacterium]
MSTALDAFRTRISAADCAAALVLNPVNIRYLTGYHSNAYSRPLTLVVPVHGDPVFLVPRLEAQQARTLTGVQDVRDYVEWADGAHAGGAPEAEWGALLADVLRSTQGRIAVEEAALTPSRAKLLHNVLRLDLSLDATGWIDALRIVKSPQEVENHRRAAALAGVGIDAALAAVHRSASEREIYADAAHAMLTEAARAYPDEPVAVAGNAIVGPRTASLHLPATGIRPVAGDLVFIVLVASIGGSWCELSRTVIAAREASAEQARVFRAVARA